MRAWLLLVFAGCGSAPEKPCVPAGTEQRTFVVDQLVMPRQAGDNGWDLDGDGRLENRFGNLFFAMAYLGVDLATDAERAPLDGYRMRVMVQSTDPAQRNSGAATVIISDGGSQDIAACGELRDGVFETPRGAIVETVLHMPYLSDITVPIVLAHLRLVVREDRLLAGELHAAVRHNHVRELILPGAGAYLGRWVAAAPPGAADAVLANIDTGGARGECQAKAGDKVIEPCEFATDGLVRGLLSPDVNLFDAAGNWHPARGQDPDDHDALSLGIGFGGRAE